jgi:hypothetical protein
MYQYACCAYDIVGPWMYRFTCDYPNQAELFWWLKHCIWLGQYNLKMTVRREDGDDMCYTHLTERIVLEEENLVP